MYMNSARAYCIIIIILYSFTRGYYIQKTVPIVFCSPVVRRLLEYYTYVSVIYFVLKFRNIQSILRRHTS